MKRLKRLLVCLSLVLLMGVATACFGPKPDQIVKDYMDATIAIDVKKQNEHRQTPLSEDELKQVEKEMADLFNSSDKYSKPLVEKLKTVYQSAKYEIVDTKKDGDKATVTVKITSKKVLKAIMGSVGEYIDDIFTRAVEDPNFGNMTEDDISKELLDKVLKAMDEAESIEQTVNVNLIKIDKKWKIADESADRISYALLGTSAKEIEELQNYWPTTTKK